MQASLLVLNCGITHAQVYTVNDLRQYSVSKCSVVVLGELRQHRQVIAECERGRVFHIHPESAFEECAAFLNP